MGASVSWKSCPNAAKSCKLAGINPYPGPEAPAKVWIAVSAQAFTAAPGSCLFGDSSIMATSFPLTKHGAQLLKDELQRLKSVERPNVINAIAEARAQGDLSENAEYESAKERQSFIEGRIAELEGKLSAAQIIDPAPPSSSRPASPATRSPTRSSVTTRPTSNCPRSPSPARWPAPSSASTPGMSLPSRHRAVSASTRSWTSSIAESWLPPGQYRKGARGNSNGPDLKISRRGRCRPRYHQTGSSSSGFGR